MDSLLQGLQTPERQVRTRIYITSESHVHSLLNLLRFATARYAHGTVTVSPRV